MSSPPPFWRRRPGSGRHQDQPADLFGKSLTITDPAGKTRVFLGFTEKDFAGVFISDNEGEQHIELSVNPRGNVSQLNMTDINNKMRNQYFTNGEGAGLVVNNVNR